MRSVCHESWPTRCNNERMGYNPVFDFQAGLKMANIRTFVAVDLSEQQRQQALRLINKLSTVGAGYRWVQSESMHITLNFLGDVPETEITQVCSIVRNVAETRSGFELSIASAGAFPDIERPRVVWAGVDRGHQELIAIHAELTTEFAKLGFPPEARVYSPHLTLGRIKRAGRPEEELCESIRKLNRFSCGVTDVDQLVVYSSFLDRSGPDYTAIARSPLQGR